MAFAKHIILACLTALAFASAANAIPASPSQRVQLFATCAGRFSAMIEFRRLSDNGLEITDMARIRAFEALVEAILPDAVEFGMPQRQALAWRIQSKAVQSSLLHTAHYHIDPRRAEPALEAAMANLAACDGLLLGE